MSADKDEEIPKGWTLGTLMFKASKKRRNQEKKIEKSEQGGRRKAKGEWGPGGQLKKVFLGEESISLCQKLLIGQGVGILYS